MLLLKVVAGMNWSCRISLMIKLCKFSFDRLIDIVRFRVMYKYEILILAINRKVDITSNLKVADIFNLANKNGYVELMHEGVPKYFGIDVLKNSVINESKEKVTKNLG